MIQPVPLVVIEPIFVVAEVAQGPSSIECGDYAQIKFDQNPIELNETCVLV